MKTKVYWLTLLASAAIISQMQAHGLGGGGAGFSGGAHFGGARLGGGRAAIGRAAPAPAYQTAPVRTFAPNHATYNRSTVGNRSVRNRAADPYSQRSIANVDRAHNLPSNWRNHVYGRQSANWHRDWDHSRVYWWNGHRCRFVNGNWVIFDIGFDPGWWWPCPGYYYGYPCDEAYYDY